MDCHGPSLLVVLLLLTTTFASISLAQSTTEAPTNETTLKCPRVGFQFFFKNLNQSIAYRVAIKQQQNQMNPNETVQPFGYWNATVSFVRTPHSAFLVFKCSRPDGMTCDVFTAWRDADTGDLRALRNVLDIDLQRPELENILSIEKQGGLYFWCDPERRRRSQFTLVPIVQQQNDTESTAAVCSAEHGNYFGGDAEECDVQYLEQMLILNDLKATSGLNKRALLMSIVLMALIGMTLIAITMAQWMNKTPRITVAK